MIDYNIFIKIIDTYLYLNKIHDTTKKIGICSIDMMDPITSLIAEILIDSIGRINYELVTDWVHGVWDGKIYSNDMKKLNLDLSKYNKKESYKKLYEFIEEQERINSYNDDS